MNKFLFYLLSFTWGLPMTLIGLIVALVLLITGHKPKKYGYCLHFEVGDCWGGLNLGIVFLTDKTPSTHTKNHEHGHGLQNCYFGPLTPFIVVIPSAYRYWLRECDYKNMNVFSWVVFGAGALIASALIIVSYLCNTYWLFILAMILLAYFAIITVWALGFEIPKYEDGKYVDYDDFWAEADATKRGTEFIESLGDK